MKKIILSFFLIFSLLFIFSFPAFAQENTGEATKSAQKIDYDLPYPGMLPDNPLYILKTARDRIVSILISDPFKKAEFNLLTSDKRINAARMLSEKNKPELAVSTLSKSNNYFHGALSSAIEAKDMGKNVDTVLHNLKLASLKHREVLAAINKRVGKNFEDQLQYEEKRLREFEKSVNNILPE